MNSDDKTKGTIDSFQQESEPQRQLNFNTIVPQDFTPPDMVQNNRKKKVSPAWITVISIAFVGVLLLIYLRLSTAVLITTVPENAQVQVSGFSPFIANSHLLLAGNYRVTATAKGYYESVTELTVEGADSQALEVVLTPLPGHVDIISNVSELSVVVNGQPYAESLPGIIKNLPQGSYEFAFSSYRYFPQKVNFEVEGFDKLQELAVDMLPAWGELNVTTLPGGADISVDGNFVGKTPLNIEVLETGSDISLLKSGFNPWSKTLVANAGETAEYPVITLEPADGVVEVRSTPSGASLTIDGVFAGKTPFDRKLSSGHVHHMKLFAKGYKVLNKDVQLEPEERRTMSWTLKPELGDVQFRLSPSSAQIFIDGKLRGTGNQVLSLLAIEQVVDIKLNGYVSQQLRLAPRVGLTQSVTVNLLTEKQHYWAQFPNKSVGPANIEMTLMRPDSTFTMGTARRESGRRSNEAERNVKIDKPFYIATFETTNAQFQQFKRDHNSLQIAAMSLNNANQPVVNVSWLAAAKFCNWLSSQAQLTPVYDIEKDRLQKSDMSANGYRLPTEAEWSWVARVDVKNKNRRFVWGDNYPPAEAVANYADQSAQTLLGKSVPRYNDGFIVTAPVGSFPADAKGLFDIAGNVSEWTHDFYSTSPNKGTPELNPSGPSTGRDHVVRGASWKHGARTEIRLSYRKFGGPPALDVGFRVSRNIE
ncbi:MAG: sulfatase activating formylglycine-generating enzyme [Oceanicoccus sp.]|jgi:formylglycine-generating enzyme required for sulfatase activity